MGPSGHKAKVRVHTWRGIRKTSENLEIKRSATERKTEATKNIWGTKDIILKNSVETCKRQTRGCQRNHSIRLERSWKDLTVKGGLIMINTGGTKEAAAVKIKEKVRMKKTRDKSSTSKAK